ncbi:MAG: response regulator receiver protein [Alphaproteobacteria bacterium]|jgi:DNA-binding response OmpR family regulator|nr:response regulator receiver protein [Alphaproteobacteria bacterium]
MKKPCIIIVEAELAIRQPVSDYLRECGYRVIEAVNTDEAVELVEKSGVEIDIVLADAASTGVLGGFGLAKWIKSKKPEIDVVLAGSVQKVAEQAGELCAEGPQLARPYHHETLHDKIKALLGARARHNPPDSC